MDALVNYGSDDDLENSENVKLDESSKFRKSHKNREQSNEERHRKRSSSSSKHVKRDENDRGERKRKIDDTNYDKIRMDLSENSKSSSSDDDSTSSSSTSSSASTASSTSSAESKKSINSDKRTSSTKTDTKQMSAAAAAADYKEITNDFKRTGESIMQKNNSKEPSKIINTDNMEKKEEPLTKDNKFDESTGSGRHRNITSSRRKSNDEKRISSDRSQQQDDKSRKDKYRSRSREKERSDRKMDRDYDRKDRGGDRERDNKRSYRDDRRDYSSSNKRGSSPYRYDNRGRGGGDRDRYNRDRNNRHQRYDGGQRDNDRDRYNRNYQRDSRGRNQSEYSSYGRQSERQRRSHSRERREQRRRSKSPSSPAADGSDGTSSASGNIDQRLPKLPRMDRRMQTIIANKTQHLQRLGIELPKLDDYTIVATTDDKSPTANQSSSSSSSPLGSKSYKNINSFNRITLMPPSYLSQNPSVIGPTTKYITSRKLINPPYQPPPPSSTSVGQNTLSNTVSDKVQSSMSDPTGLLTINKVQLQPKPLLPNLMTTSLSSDGSFINAMHLTNPKYNEQIQKRKLLWSHKKLQNNTGDNDNGGGGAGGDTSAGGTDSSLNGNCTLTGKNVPGSSSAAPLAASTTNKWEMAKFAQDTDGKVASKFMRLMGIKDTAKVGAAAATASASSSASDHEAIDSADKDIIKKQEELFTTMEQQYEVARAVTHTMRGVGLGFGQPRSF